MDNSSGNLLIRLLAFIRGFFFVKVISNYLIIVFRLIFVPHRLPIIVTWIRIAYFRQIKKN